MDNKQLILENDEIALYGVESTPFAIKHNKKENTFDVTMGKFKLSNHNTYEEAEKECLKIDWNRLVKVIYIITEGENLEKLAKTE